MCDAIRMMESKMTPESVARSRLMAEKEILAINGGQTMEYLGEEPEIVVDEDEMAEILASDDDLKKGIDDIENGRYRIVG